ncbi:MAG: IS200/IS605 family transposase [Carboxylicivirga sp.]|jgi:REP element-mobilizing transposase RayT|nr:IS200/IS605 family transposase [Carboxylicivirga sp.]
MSTYTQILYQIVFSTKGRKCTLNGDQERLYKFIWGILNNKKCYLYRIGGVNNHIHIITSIHPSVALAQLVKDIKLSSSKYIKTECIFPEFNGWQEGYGAFTYHSDAKDVLIEYVKTQELHHQLVDFKGEYRQLLKEHGIKFEEKYLF